MQGGVLAPEWPQRGEISVTKVSNLMQKYHIHTEREKRKNNIIHTLQVEKATEKRNEPEKYLGNGKEI